MNPLLETRKQEFDDHESFREMVESIIASRSVQKKRKFPRFPSPVSLLGKLGNHEFDGILVVADPDNVPQVKKVEFQIVDFSESGLQLQLEKLDFFILKKCSLFLEINSQNFPVRIMWCKQNSNLLRAGFKYYVQSDTDVGLTAFTSDLIANLIDFLMDSYLDEPSAFTLQSGVFAYIAILYGLRLKFLETVAKRNNLLSYAMLSEKNSTWDVLRYSCEYHLEYLFENENDPALPVILSKYLTPYYTFGGRIKNASEQFIFTKHEVTYIVLNSIIISDNIKSNEEHISDKLTFLYNRFLQLKHLFMQNIFDGELVEIQFRKYSSIISEIEQLCNILMGQISEKDPTSSVAKTNRVILIHDAKLAQSKDLSPDQKQME